MPSWPPGGRSTPTPKLLAKLLQTAAGDDPIFHSMDDLLDRAKLEAAVARKVRSVRARIGVMWKELPKEARGVILQMAREEDASRKQVGAEWLVQRMLFLEIGTRYRLEQVERFSRSRPDCFLVLTQRGSLITGDALEARGRRTIEYIRIPSRARSWTDPVTFHGKTANLRCGHRARLPGLRSSPVQFILVVPKARSAEFGRITHVTSAGLGSTFFE